MITTEKLDRFLSELSDDDVRSAGLPYGVAFAKLVLQHECGMDDCELGEIVDVYANLLDSEKHALQVKHASNNIKELSA